jgi:hypothetical protein
MRRLVRERGILWLFFATIVASPMLAGYAAKKTTYESSISLPIHQFEADGFCGTLAGWVRAGDFLKGLQRIETKQGIEFRKKSKIVRQFPEEVGFDLTGTIGSCPTSLPNSETVASLNDFVNSLSISADWLDGNVSQTVGDLSVTRTLPVTRWFSEYEKPQWGLSIKVPSKAVPIVSVLVVSLLSKSGHKMMNITFAL